MKSYLSADALYRITGLSGCWARIVKSKCATSTDGKPSEERRIAMTESSSMFSDDRPLHEQLADHIANCSQCTEASQGKRPVGIGARSPFCSYYQDIIAVWAEKEGRANNIVDHDEFGNKASGADYWDNRPGGF